MGQWARAAQGNVFPQEQGQRGFTPYLDGRQLGLAERLLFWEAGSMAHSTEGASEAHSHEAGQSWL